MSYAIVITKNARKDIQEAIYWENNRQADLADRLLISINQKLITISETPYIFAVRYDEIRCVLTKVFAYLIHYIVNEADQQVIILRILHTSRKPIW